MTWTRLRPWVGRNPVAAVNIVTVGCALALLSFGAIFVFGDASGPVDLLVLPLYLACIAVVGTWTGCVACLLLRANRSLRCMGWMVPSTLAILAGPGLCLLVALWPVAVDLAGWAVFLLLVLANLLYSLPFIAAQGVGCGVAAVVARVTLRGDRKQVLVALDDPPAKQEDSGHGTADAPDCDGPVPHIGEGEP